MRMRRTPRRRSERMQDIRRVVALAVVAVSVYAAHNTGVSQQATQKQKPKSADTQQQSGMGGISSAGSFAPVYDAEKRPITAGGFVANGTVVFEDATRAAGLSGWQHVMGTKTKKYILETDGSGVGLIDYDNDGWLDIYLVNGSTYDALTGKRTPPHAALFHNNHDGTFTDVAAKAGVTNDRWGFGVAIARLRQRWLAGYFCLQFRQEPAVPQQSRRNVYRRGGEGGRDAGQLVRRRDVGRLRRRRAAGSVCVGIRALRPESSARSGQWRCAFRRLPVAWVSR